MFATYPLWFAGFMILLKLIQVKNMGEGKHCNFSSSKQNSCFDLVQSQKPVNRIHDSWQINCYWSIRENWLVISWCELVYCSWLAVPFRFWFRELQKLLLVLLHVGGSFKLVDQDFWFLMLIGFHCNQWLFCQLESWKSKKEE